MPSRVAGSRRSIRDGDYAEVLMEAAGIIGETFERRTRALEEQWLSPRAVRSFDTLGRTEPEESCGVRTPFQRDRDRIVHSKPFRRL
jgi:dGTPase